MMTRLHDPEYRAFASDNYAGAHPEILEAIAAANGGHQVAYGEDVYTARLQEVFADALGGSPSDGSPSDETVAVFPVFNGTGANVTALQSMLPRWGAVVAASTAHINTDENGAPERVGGLKLLTVDTPDGKLTPELINRQAWGWGDEHRAQPLVVSLTQTTELGTCYRVDELRAITDHAHSLGMRVHMDGARIANAAAFLDAPLRAFTHDAGIDVLSFGGTKNGLLFGEAVVVLDPAASDGLQFLRKVDMQLASKMRFISAQLIALLTDDLWLRSARHANAMAARLRGALEQAVASGRAPGLSFTQPTESNGVFAALPREAAERVRATHRFYDWGPVAGEPEQRDSDASGCDGEDAARGEVRWMCSWDTTEADVDGFVAAVLDALDP
jgi:threonine aldolase